MPDELIQLDQPTLDMLREKSKASLFFFAKAVLGYSKLDSAIHLPICSLLEDTNNLRLKICIPRGWYKTTLCSIAFPIWCAVRDPNVKILLVQNTITNAVAKLRAIDDTFKKNDLFRALFPEILPDKTCVWKSESMCVKRSKPAVESTFEAAGTRSKVVSRHYDLIIEDDTVAPDLDQMTSETITPSKEDIEQAIGFHKLCSPLLENVGRSRWLVVGTRWYERDLLSYIHDQQKSFIEYTRAAREPDDSGELVPSFPAQFPDAVLDTLRNEDLGPYMFSCLYMNAPIRSEEMIFQKDWFRWWSAVPQHDDVLFYTTADPAGDPDQSKRKNARKKTDWNVVLTTAKDLRTGLYYVVEYTRRKCNPSVFLDMIFDHHQRFHPIVVGVETVAYQQSLVHWIGQRQIEGKQWFRIEPLTQNKLSKNERIRGLQPLTASGRLLFGAHQRELVSELEAFPLAAHDDLSDALAMHLQLWNLSGAENDPETQAPTSIVPGEVAEIRSRSFADPALDLHAEFYGRWYEYEWN